MSSKDNLSMNKTEDTNYVSITKPASKVMLGGIFALFGGLSINIVVAALFGAGTEMDAYMTAMVIPGYFQIIFYSSLSFVLIPAFIDMEMKKNENEAWALIGTFFWLVTGILIAISLIVFLTSSDIIKVIAPGFEQEKAALASQMLSVLIFTVPFSGLSILTIGIQNSRNRFFWPSTAPAFGALINLVILLIFSKSLGSLVLCWGYLASTVIQSSFTILPVLSHGWKRKLPITQTRVKEIIRMMLPLFLFGLVISISPLVERYYASGLPNGEISYMGYANKISSIFVLVLASGIASAIFPSMARAYSSDGVSGLVKKSDFGMQLTIALALPTVLFIGVIAIPLVSVFFERGAFNHTDTVGVSRILFAFVLGEVLFRMIGNVLQRSLYVLKDTITLPVISSALMVLFIATMQFFVTRWGYSGIVWARTTRNGLEVLIVWILLLRKLPIENLGLTGRKILKYCLAAITASVIGSITLLVIASQSSFIQLIISILVSVSVYLFILYLFDKEMLISILEVTGFRYFIEKIQPIGKIFFQIRY
jgi:putative peptidoglycan lipid II flippase